MLTRDDCIEIECALASKVAGIQHGVYGPDDAENRQWATHLEWIMERIGPNGERLYEALVEMLEALENIEANLMGCDNFPERVADSLRRARSAIAKVQD